MERPPAFVPGLANDLFVSYAHDDDATWVRALCDNLASEVSRRLGVPIALWRDTNRLRAGLNWQAEIQAGIEQSAAFVAIVSPNYQNSEWCALERQAFLAQLGDQQYTSGRFFKAVKTPWPEDRHQLFLEAIQDVDFYKTVEGTATEFKRGTREFTRAVTKLADGVEPLLRRMRRASQRVHVAWPATECVGVWREVTAELRAKGFDVQPTGPRDPSFHERLLRDDMDRAALSVHLLGTRYDAFTRRVAILAADGEYPMAFWIADTSDTAIDKDQRGFLESIRAGLRPENESRELPPGWWLMGDVNIRRFIAAVIAKLRPLPPGPDDGSDDVSKVYIVHDSTTVEDAKVALHLKEQIREREKKMEVFLSSTELSTPSEARLRHEQLLRSCDGLLLFRNAAPDGWWNELAPDLNLVRRRFPRQQPIKSQAFLVPEPPRWTVDPDVRVIPYLPSFTFESLEPFLSPLRTDE